MSKEESLARAFRLMENGKIHVSLLCDNPNADRLETPTYCPGCYCKHKRDNQDKLLEAMDEYDSRIQNTEEFLD